MITKEKEKKETQSTLQLRETPWSKQIMLSFKNDYETNNFKTQYMKN